MKFLKRIYTFLGGFRFAIFLIALTVMFVIAGTFLESKTQSHRYAALWTYQNPIFYLLLWGFFINILFSALRRWPFKYKHIPFLITHLGLLMILGGVLIKNAYGTQGSMLIAEGSGTDEILLTEKPGLLIQTKSERRSVEFPKSKTKALSINDLNIKIVKYAPHAHENYAAWIKGPHAFILGLEPLIVQKDANEMTPPSGKVRFHGHDSDVWNVKVVQTETPFVKGSVGKNELLIAKDSENITHICCLDKGGKMFSESFSPDKLDKYIAYDQGFGGYTIPVKLPISPHEIQLESPLYKEYKEVQYPTKLEDFRPVVVLELTEDTQKDYIVLGYDPHANGLKWPALDGKYVFRFQPYIQKIPYFVRLHNARQINYSNSNQPFSYESDITVKDHRSNEEIHTTLRMNHVHETWDGYRFYMSSISPGDDSAIHRVQIVVNHDPAKYWLTYPGAVILALGIVMLFWLNPYKF